MKFINLKVLLFAALFTPFALSAQTCLVDTSFPDGRGDCGVDENGPTFDRLRVSGNGDLNLTSFTDLRGVTIEFTSSVNAMFSGATLIDDETIFVSENNKGKVKIDTETGNFTFTGNQTQNNNNKVGQLNREMAECPDGNACTLTNRSEAFVMPVTLMSWSTRLDGTYVSLVWETADETDNSHFVVSRSTDGVTFTELATIGGQGTTGNVSTYRYRDQQPATGVNYYRLEQFDYDGTQTELGVQSINFGGAGSANLMLSPNPVASGQRLTIDSQLDDNAEVEIYAPNGSHVGNFLVQGRSFQVPTLTPGVYTLRLNGQATRLVVAR